MKINAPKKLYIDTDDRLSDSVLYGFTEKRKNNDIEYICKDVFIENTCKWLKENITNNPNANSVLVRNGCVTLGMLVDDFKKYMEDNV